MLLAGNIFPDYLSGFAQLMSSLAGLEPQEARFILIILRKGPGSIRITLASAEK